MRRNLLLLSFLLLSSCSIETTSSHFVVHNYDEIEEYKISYLDVFKRKDQVYYLYYYQTTCFHCTGIKTKIIEYAINSEIPFYFVEIEKDEGFLSYYPKDTIGTNNPLKAFARMTPQLSKVEKGKIKETVVGTEEILLIIE